MSTRYNYNSNNTRYWQQTDTVVSVADTTSFASFNGITTHTGEALIGMKLLVIQLELVNLQ